ncbi:MAG TPA: L,D-transpeptidase [Gammaproteobacteria bacterium]|jgi:L,D-transpeptidase YbiS|nr:L,D-transpeptidase [Pseudomonadota bacterium]HAY47144.1 L,D-transpeptidase [Gammaproteobacteria bacterium]
MPLLVDINKQVLKLYDGSNLKSTYPISTALNGVGQKIGSECTPLGAHIIRAKIGAGAPLNAVFVARRQTGEIYSRVLEQQSQLEGNPRDWILTRILWLSGREVGRNRLGECDTMRRFIYIHGCPDSHQMQTPNSHGCIKMRNADVVDLFDRVFVGESIDIVESDDSHVV